MIVWTDGENDVAYDCTEDACISSRDVLFQWLSGHQMYIKRLVDGVVDTTSENVTVRLEQKLHT